MKFFIPAADSPEQTKNVLESTKKFAEENLGFKYGDKKIFKLEFRHDGKTYTAEVGKKETLTGYNEIVVLILSPLEQHNPYIICTPNRGVIKGGPIMVGKHDIISCDYFEE